MNVYDILGAVIGEVRRRPHAMKIILANPRGFCAGVNMAIESLERSLDLFGAPLYVYHEIVHNKYVVERFRRRGVVFVEQLSEVPEGAPLLYSAHGVSPQIREEARRRRLRAIDATCPLVTKVHLEAVKYAKEGYTIVLIGHEGHDEVIGTMGEAPQRMILVETAEDVQRLDIGDPEKIAYLTQTTLSVDDANVVIAALRERFPQIANPPKDDICYATQNRQEAVRELAARADLVLVLGSQNSSNSRRLAEIANSLGRHAHLIDGVGEIRPEWLEGVITVLITAGASAPEDVVHDCVEFLQDRYGATVDEEWVREESVHFPLPKTLRELLPAGEPD
jgi:4-hydroxy-3-methylbut-2-enyl diphosphate reductase